MLGQEMRKRANASCLFCCSRRPTLSFAAGDSTLPLRRLALYIGSNNGGPGRVTLRFAEEDARSMAGVMQELGGVSGEDSCAAGPHRQDLQLGFRQARQAWAVRSPLWSSGLHSCARQQGLLLGELFGYRS
jgi:hypothetical protein